MGSENEPAKLLLPYLQRADELQKHEPLVAYYCRLYAMERGLKIPQGERTKTTSALLVSLMNQLEKDKKSLKFGPEDSFHIEGFALNVFAKADKQDRADRSDLNTAKTFYAASIFFEILNQFGPLQPDLEQKQKYAAWKAADIRKALKEGRKPIAGPPAGEEDLTIPSSTRNGGYGIGASESTFTGLGPESDPSPNFTDTVDYQHYSNKPPSPKFHDNLNNQSSAEMPPPSQFHDKVNNQYSTISPSSQPYPSTGYPTHDFHQSDPSSGTDSHYSQPYNHQVYPQEYQHHRPPNYPSQESSPSYPLPHFQSYPSFTESTFPSMPSNYPTYYQFSESSTFLAQPASQTTSYSSSIEQNPRSRNGPVNEPTSASPHSYLYDPNYQPPPEKIAEAHKAARFAVGALAFDEVSVAVDHLRKSLELLTNPSSVK